MEKKPMKYFVVDAFAESAFKGNPAAVCMLEEDRDDQWLQSLASEFNLPVTCCSTRMINDSATNGFTSPPAASCCRFALRWFSPVREVKLCDHSTLAAANTLFNSGFIDSNIVEFCTLSGILSANKVLHHSKAANDSATSNGDSYLIELNFPADPSTEYNSADASLVSKAFGGATVIHTRTTIMDNLLVVLPSGNCVAEILHPQFDAIEQCPGSMGVIVTGLAPPESGYDSRFFCPKFGVNEITNKLHSLTLDQVCGSAHCALAPYWCKKLGKNDVVAYQASPRGDTTHSFRLAESTDTAARKSCYCHGRNYFSLTLLLKCIVHVRK